MSTHNGDNTTREDEAARLTAYALGQLPPDELSAMKANLAADGGETAQRELREIEAIGAALATARNTEPLPPTSFNLRKAIEQQLAEPVSRKSTATESRKAKPHKPRRRLVIPAWSTAASLLLAIALLPIVQRYREAARRMQAGNHVKQLGLGIQNYHDTFQSLPFGARASYQNSTGNGNVIRHDSLVDDLGRENAARSTSLVVTPRIIVQEEERAQGLESKRIEDSLAVDARNQRAADNPAFREHVLDGYATTPAGIPLAKEGQGQSDPFQLANKTPGFGGRGKYAGGMPGSGGGGPGGYGGGMPDGGYGGEGARRQLGRTEVEQLASETNYRDRLQLAELSSRKANADLGARNELVYESDRRKDEFQRQRLEELRKKDGRTGEQYEPIFENAFLSPLRQPLSTFSIDVDTASYANVRRFLNSGRLPPPNSVRIEELVNYFRYDYPQPKGDSPFAVHMEVAECPWNEGHWLLKVGLKGKEVQRSERPASNLVFLLDVSGSMADQNKLPLLKTAMKLLVGELGENDRVSIVTYAGEAGLRLPPTRGHEQHKISSVIDSLSAGGSTNGSAGINLAYEQAAAYFVPGGTNRVILCTDGDLNVGITSDDALIKLIKQKAAGGTFLTVLGFGEGNLKDAKMEKLADNGNGLYAYIDSVREARKVLVEQLTGSTITIAKDVKIQIEFNPAQIAAYRLLGYENRVLAAQDFNNDKKDAGEIGAGHTVTALYELVPVESATREPAEARPGVDPLKYQQPGANLLPEQRGQRFDSSRPGPGLVPANGNNSTELLTLKLRYKQPEAETSKLLEFPLKDKAHSFNSASPDLQFAAAVASFGMILRSSEHRGASNLAAVGEIAAGALGNDPGGYRAEFLDLIRKAQSLRER